MLTHEFAGVKFELPDYLTLQDPAEYVKTQLGLIVSRLKYDTIFDSMTGYAVGTLHRSEIHAMLDQIWHTELAASVQAIMESKPWLTAADFLSVIEEGVDQLRIRMLATVRPTPALAFNRDQFALERLRQADPHRVTAYLMIRLLTDNHFQRAEINGLEDILVRHESAIKIGTLVQKCKDSAAMAKMARQLIELDARYDIVRIRFSRTKQDLIRGFQAIVFDGPRVDDTLFRSIESFARGCIAECERMEAMESGNRAMRSAFVEKTKEEVMAGILKEADRIQKQRDGVVAYKAGAKSSAKGRTINLSGVDFSAFMGGKSS